MVAVGLTLAAGLSAHAVPEPHVVARHWGDYARRSIRCSGRVVDRAGGRITTSEGQAYAMVQAVWADDRASFERIRRWSIDHLQGGDPTRLPAWKWHRGAVVDPQPAADADVWMAWSLLLAAEKWQHRAYHDQARALMMAIWQQEVAVVSDRRVLLPGPWASDTDPTRLNPSYFLPFAWRAFAVADPAHPWGELIDDAYAILADAGVEGRLAPDWLYLDPTTAAPVSSPVPDHDHHGFEALRLPWTLAAEVVWYDDPRARALLAPYLDWQSRWSTHGWLPAVAHPDGSPAVEYPHLSLYGALLPAWGALAPDAATRLYTDAIAPTRGRRGWGDVRDYYAQNWVWFGLALWSGLAVPPEMIP